MDDSTGMCIVGGYLGKRRNWAEYADAWATARLPFDSVHLAEMRLGSKRGKERYEDMLRRLGAVPAACKLKPVLGSIRHSDYRERVKGSVSGLILAPYVMAIIAMLDSLSCMLPKGERVEIIFEQQTIYAEQRARAVALWSSLPSHKNADGRAIIARTSSIPKGIMTEASDFLCFALAQRDINIDSQKARLTSPILDSQRYWRKHTKRDVVHFWLDQVDAENKRPFREITPELRKMIRKG